MNSERPASSTVRDVPRLSASSAASRHGGVELGRPEGPGHRPVLVDHDRDLPALRSRPGLVRPERRRRGIRRERGHHGDAVVGQRGIGGDGDRVRHDRLDQDVDRAAAGEADVPGLLVADAVADHPGSAGLPSVVDLLGRRALDAAAADRTRDATVRGVQQDRPLGSWRRTERPDDDGPADVDAVAPPRPQRLEQFLHCSGLAAPGSTRSPPTTPGRP